MRFFKYLVFIFFSIVSFQTFAAYKYSVNTGTGSYDSALAACQAVLDNYKSTRSDAANWSINTTALPAKCEIWGGSYWAFSQPIQKTEVADNCPSAGTTQTQSVPFRLLDSQVCINSCLWNPAGTGPVCGDNSGICSDDFKSAGTSCSQNTDLTPTQSDIDSTKPVDPPMQCTSDYCEKPSDKSCPSGYTKQMFNNKDYCVKDGANPPNNNPDQPSSSEPQGNGDGTCNGTNNCNTNNYNFDVSQIVNAINAQTSAITSAISQQTSALSSAISSAASSINSSLSSGFKSVTDAIGLTNSKLDLVKNEQVKTNEKLDKSNDHLKQIEESGKAASEALGDIRDSAHSASETLGDIKEGVDESNSIWKGIKDWLFDENGSSVSNVDLPTEGIAAGQIDYNLFKVNAQCPVSPQLLVSLSHASKSFNIDYSQLCDILRYMGYLISIVAALHAGQILVRDS